MGEQKSAFAIMQEAAASTAGNLTIYQIAGRIIGIVFISLFLISITV